MTFTVKALAGATLSLCASATLATTVQFQTVMGDFEVNLYDESTPETVANFLEYVSSGDYANTFIHRSVPGFIVQGGGYTFEEGFTYPQNITPNDPVGNEPVFANVRGTIAMAKTPTSPDSATNQWFFNLADNSANLDNQNGGFTVFGEVTGNGMAIVDAIADLDKAELDGTFSDLPLRDFASGDSITIDETYLVMIQNIVVLDAAPDTAAGLNPTPTTASNDSDGGNDGGGSSSGGGGGSFGLSLLALLALAGISCKVRSTKAHV
ncbi:peptidylprolyl isomerase [Gilvimarinus sp. SDUM040013]|uniref:Peptidyl-prolyl cis-trans isomerase n=1 Tax=Gilvimarinus gilvus TaxID=3058038 RepID=A0ABU4RTG1_9GAMM|nr:peptidylprolyl isomerase [Gilvimarinus sp. SDUM040013]MDO3386931.1 peptidylprolyl isomerase [Gilvimarinus sp. SDUM040013]MDX6848175.1 peptidylprolyl isomerase [Gilvimarinus sp. SDUM040013]